MSLEQNPESKDKNIVLLGGSNCIIKGGLQAGLNQDNIKFTNLALGGASSLQRLYELKREKNKAILENADIIIFETNINDIGISYDKYEALDIKIILRNIEWIFEELYFLNKKILVLLLPFFRFDSIGRHNKIIVNFHKKFCEYYGFNLINMHDYYRENDLIDFSRKIDPTHPHASIMRELGKNIIKYRHTLRYPRALNIKRKNPNFMICTPNDMKIISDKKLEKIELKNSAFKESAYRIDDFVKLQFSEKYDGYYLIGIHSWLSGDNPKKNFRYIFGSLITQNKQTRIINEAFHNNAFLTIQNTNFRIDSQTYVYHNKNAESATEYFWGAFSWLNESKRLRHFDVISFFLADKNQISISKQDYRNLQTQNFTISGIYNFDFVIPPVEICNAVMNDYFRILQNQPFSHLCSTPPPLSSLRGNLYIRLAIDLIRLPKLVTRYVKRKYF